MMQAVAIEPDGTAEIWDNARLWHKMMADYYLNFDHCYFQC